MLPARAANLLINGSFETPVVSSSSGFQEFLTGSTAITGWTVVGNQVDLLLGTFTSAGITLQAEDGNQWLDLSANSGAISPNNGITQTISTISGGDYLLSFFVGSARNELETFIGESTVDLSINGGPRTSYKNANTTPAGAMNWLGFEVPFTATSNSTILTFLNGTPSNALNGGGDLTALDNVTVEARSINPPSTSSVPGPIPFLGAAAALGWSRRLRRRLQQGSR